MSALVADAADAVRRVGWHATGVFPVEGDETPGFTYTTGFRTTWGHPDVLISALPPRLAHRLLGQIAERIADGGRYEAGSEYEDVLGGGYKVRFVALSEEVRLERMRVTAAVYDLENFDALQMLWPDEFGRFPGEEGYTDGAGSFGQEVLT